MHYPTDFQKRTLWNATTGFSILILGALLVGLIWLTGQVFSFLQPVLIPLIVAGIIAYVFDPIVRFLEKRGMSRLWSVISVFITILIIAILLVAAVLPGIQRGHDALGDFLSSHQHTITAQTAKNVDNENSEHLSPALESALSDLKQRNKNGPISWLLSIPDDTNVADDGEKTMPLSYFAKTRGGRILQDYQGVILKTGRDWITAGSSKLLGFLGLVIGMIMVPVYLFFFLKDSASIRKEWHHYVPLKASRFKTELVETLQEINGYLISFFRGQVIVAAIDGILVGLGLMIFGLPYGLLIGVFMAILGIIPYIGNILCLIPACIIGYLHAQGLNDQGHPPFGLGAWAYVVCVVAIFVVVQQINSLVTAPKIVGDSVGLHPLTVIFSMLFWSLVLGGFVGALLAVPMTAAVKVLFRRFIWERQMRDPATPLSDETMLDT
jgi:predicted PurR-regulated permease PerM